MKVLTEQAPIRPSIFKTQPKNVGVAGGNSTSTGQQFTRVANPPRNPTVLTLAQANLALKLKSGKAV
jgi:hypothetical protein